MKVKELIKILKKIDPDKELIVWNAYHDNSTNNVKVSELNDGRIFISDWVLGTERK